MTKEMYLQIENYMLSCMEDSAHDKEHIYRVLYGALEIAKAEEHVDQDVLITACLLHDIGRKEQFADPTLCHAMVGADKAAAFLLAQGYGEEFAQKVHHCIQTHRFRKALQPQTIEAKILFDADKLDVTGAVGIARSLMYKSEVAEPLYDSFISMMQERVSAVGHGKFGADMRIEMTGDGPVTIVMDSAVLKRGKSK